MKEETQKVREKYQLKLNSDETYSFNINNKDIYVIDVKEDPSIVIPYMGSWNYLREVVSNWSDLAEVPNIKLDEEWIKAANLFMMVSMDVFHNMIDSERSVLSHEEIAVLIANRKVIKINTHKDRVNATESFRRIFEVMVLIHYVVVSTVHQLPEEKMDIILAELMPDIIEKALLNDLTPINRMPI